MTKKASADKTVTKTSQPSKTIVRREDDTAADTTAPQSAGVPVVRPTAAKARPPAPQPRADSPDANGPGQPQTTDDAHPSTAPPATRAAGVSSHEPAQATLDQLNAQLATVRGLPQYADVERELTDRIATLTASRA